MSEFEVLPALDEARAMPEVPSGRRAFFDTWSRFYDAAPAQWALYRPVHEAVLAELRTQPVRRVLDVGCGTGILTARTGALLSGLVCGLDLSFGMLEQATGRRVGPWVQANAVRLPAGNESVDAVVSTEAFHWFADHDAVLREFRRVLVPGGRIIVAVVNPRSAGAARMAQRWFARAGQPAYWPTRAEMRTRVEGAGLRVRRQRPVLRVFGLSFPTVVTVAQRTE
ncbi:MAG TPA: class I SAM-dependent methyltransferase [Acidimicrobiales bacterium]